ncbi:MAG TPA: DUF6289 family protein [Pseudonocardiaceae bacterium]
MIRRTMVALMAAAGLVVLVPAGQAQAIRGCSEGRWCGLVWYSDALHSAVIGVQLNYEQCGEGILEWGTTSRYFERMDEPC